MNKLFALLALFRKGNAVADPSLWKKRQVEATMLGGVIVAGIQVLQAFGVDLPITADDATALAAGLLVLINACLTYVTTDKIGIGSVQTTTGSTDQVLSDNSGQPAVLAGQPQPAAEPDPELYKG